jgi:rhodanese-related sulfurtransferase|tara:strand:- start:5893 stop:6201 length:309 start_codon:yes stop_codon:yes gene_type:complete
MLVKPKNMDKLKSLLSMSDVNLIDVRTLEEFQSGSVANAINIPMSEVTSRVEELKKLEPMVVFCKTGNRSGQVESYLKQQGVQQIANGGGWLELNGVLADLT